MEKHPICIIRTIEFSKNLIGTPYKKNTILRPSENEPYYCTNSKKKPTISYIKENGINSPGLFNILRRYNNLKIPGTGKIDYFFPGSIDCWVYYLKKKKRLKKINKFRKYPNGTLFIANYKNKGDKDYGHMAMMINTQKNLIIHSCNTEDKSGVIIEHFEMSNSWFGGKYYTYYCDPKDWILIE